MRRLPVIQAGLLAILCGCAASASHQAFFDAPVRRPAAAAIIFDPVPGPVGATSFVRQEWPSTPRERIVEEEETRWRETVWDRQCRHGDHYHRAFRSQRRGRATTR